MSSDDSNNNKFQESFNTPFTVLNSNKKRKKHTFRIEYKYDGLSGLHEEIQAPRMDIAVDKFLKKRYDASIVSVKLVIN